MQPSLAHCHQVTTTALVFVMLVNIIEFCLCHSCHWHHHSMQNFNTSNYTLKKKKKDIRCIFLVVTQGYSELLKTELRTSDFQHFIGSPDTGNQFIYLLYLIWSRNGSAIKRAESSCETKRPTINT